MSQFSDILQIGILPGLGMEPATEGGFQAWVSAATFVPSEPVDDLAAVLGRTASDRFVRAVNYDFERFSLAALETFSTALAEREKYPALGWPLLKVYYASFFAAHAIMRSRGAGVAKLDRPHMERLNELLDVYGISKHNLTPGMFVFGTSKGSSDAAGERTVSLRPDRPGRGVHEGFWIEFCTFMEAEAATAATRGDPDAGTFVSLAAELKDAVLSGAQGPVWLSAVRNQINYQHGFDVWFPSRKSSEAYRSMDVAALPRSSSVQVSTRKDKTPIKAFIHVASYISELCFDLSGHVAVGSTKGNAFGQKWRRLTETLS